MQTKDNSSTDRFPIIDLWDKYEKIAMHFNDLIIRIRIQALGAVAAISAIVGLMSRDGDPSGGFNWELTAAVFFFLGLFWVAIWLLDFKYYNCLLRGAVVALIELEEASKTNTHVHEIQLSTRIEDAVAGQIDFTATSSKAGSSAGPTTFYIMVFGGLVLGFVCSLYKCIF